MKERKVFHTEFSDIFELDHPLAASNWWRKPTIILSEEACTPDEPEKSAEFDFAV